MHAERKNQNSSVETRNRRVSLKDVESDTIDLRMLEVAQRLERLQSKALMAVGTILASK